MNEYLDTAITVLTVMFFTAIILGVVSLGVIALFIKVFKHMHDEQP